MHSPQPQEINDGEAITVAKKTVKHVIPRWRYYFVMLIPGLSAGDRWGQNCSASNHDQRRAGP